MPFLFLFIIFFAVIHINIRQTKKEPTNQKSGRESRPELVFTTSLYKVRSWKTKRTADAPGKPEKR